MTGIDSVNPPSVEAISGLVKSSFRKIGDWAGKVIRWIQNTPYHMNNSRNTAVAVLTTANVAFFALNYQFANWIDKKIEKHPEGLGDDEKKFKYTFVNVLLVGGSTLTFNYLLSKLTRYPLSNVTAMAIAGTAIAARILLRHLDMAKVKSLADSTKQNLLEARKKAKATAAKAIEKARIKQEEADLHFEEAALKAEEDKLKAKREAEEAKLKAAEAAQVEILHTTVQAAEEQLETDLDAEEEVLKAKEEELKAREAKLKAAEEELATTLSDTNSDNPEKKN